VAKGSEIVNRKKTQNHTKKKEREMDRIKNFFKDESGATAVEYGLMVALIAVVIITAVTALGTSVRDTFQTAADTIGSAS
jgi:pilus assembly protein Flp/PilA